MAYDEESWSVGYVAKWIVVDVFFILGLSLLRIPRLRYTSSVLALQLITLCLLDGLLFGSISLHLGIGAALSSAIGGAQIVELKITRVLVLTVVSRSKRCGPSPGHGLGANFWTLWNKQWR